MSLSDGEFERIRGAVEDADADEPLTAREILEVLDAHGEEFDSPHRVATVLGRRAEVGDSVEVIRDRPYKYRFESS